MLVQWCLKGIAEQAGAFQDAEALAVVRSRGLSAAWLRGQAAKSMADLPEDSEKTLSQAALDAHVNGFGAAFRTTPYLSLSAGCVELDPFTHTTRTFTALETALSFATNGGKNAGYVFRLWVLVSPKPAPELPGFAEEVRELNIFRQFSIYHREGEVAAKLYVPSRQITSVEKYDAGLSPLWRRVNPNFTPPERVSNVLDDL